VRNVPNVLCVGRRGEKSTPHFLGTGAFSRRGNAGGSLGRSHQVASRGFVYGSQSAGVVDAKETQRDCACPREKRGKGDLPHKVGASVLAKHHLLLVQIEDDRATTAGVRVSLPHR